MSFLKNLSEKYSVVSVYDGTGIEMTPSIKNMLKTVDKSKWDGILKRAWNACNDGEWLKKEYNLKYDPWDGKHEKKRREIEEDSVAEVIKLGD